MTFPVPIAIQAGRRVPPIKNFHRASPRIFAMLCWPRISILRILVLRGWLFFSLTASAPAAGTNAVEKLSNSDCLDCHTDPHNTRVVNGVKIPLAVFPTNSFQRSVHSALECTDCHTGVKELVHDANLPPPDCSGCHEKEAKDYATSIHGMSHAMGASGAANCWDCHGSHGILPVKDPSSPVFKLNLPQTCAKCHSNAGLTQGISDQAPGGRVAIHGQHPRAGAAEDGADRRAVVQRLSRRP